MFGPMQQVGQPPFLAPPGLGQLMMGLAGGQPQTPIPMPGLSLPGQNQPPMMPGWPPAPAHPLLKMMEGGDPSLPPMMWLPEEPVGVNPEMNTFGAQPGNFPVGAPGSAAPQESIWGRLAGNIMNDKALQLGLLTIGLNMMQPIQPNQTSMGHLASAIGQGINTTGSLRAREQEQKLKERQVSQGDRRIDVAERGQEGQLQQGQQRIGLDQQRLGLEGRRVETQESLAGSQIASEEQKRAQEAEAFPRTLEKLNADIARAKQAGELDEAQATLLGEKARLYPQEVRAGMIQAQAAATNARTGQQRAATEAAEAGKAPAQVRIMDHVAEAMVRSGKAKTKDEAVALLGQTQSKPGGTAASVQLLEQQKDAWRRANPRRQDESEEAYNQRAAAAELDFTTRQRQKGYLESLATYTAGALSDEERATLKREHDQIWQAERGSLPGQTPAQTPAQGGQRPMRNEVTRAEIEATAKARGMKPEEVERLLKQRNPNLVVK